MNILGLNGWNERSHDAAACIIERNNLRFAAEEERLVRKKHSFDLLPTQSILSALRYTGFTADDIDVIAFGWDLKKLLKRNISSCEVIDTFLPKNKFSYKKRPKFIFVPHHIAHAYYSYYSSPFVGQDTIILIIDGQGEEASLSLGYVSADNITLEHSFPASKSIGYFYEAVCRFLGYSNFDGGKIMGLASYGKLKYIKNFNSVLDYKNKQLIGFPDIPTQAIDIEEEVICWWLRRLSQISNLSPRHIEYVFSPAFKFEKERSLSIEEKYISVAYFAQKVLEKILLQIIEDAKQKYNTKRVVLGGGVALNCVANGALIKNGNIQLHIPCSPADSGVAIGSAICAAKHFNKKVSFSNLDSPYQGPVYTDREIKKMLDAHKISYRFVKHPELFCARLLEEDQIIGWFQGRSEFGPRALGNRSILANPLSKRNKKRLNQLKGREQWRPIGISILSEAVNEFFNKIDTSPYMMITAKANKRLKRQCPSVVHVDGSCRPQIVSKTDNPVFYHLIKSFGDKTRMPFVINTSFNRYDEPIVNSPEDALKTFYSTSLDILIMNHYVIFKK